MGGAIWLLLKSTKEADRLKTYLGDTSFVVEDLGDCWIDWTSPRRLELGYSFGGGAANCEVALLASREIAKRFAVTRIGSESTGWYREDQWSSTDPEGPVAHYGPLPNWVEWIKAYKREFSYAYKDADNPLLRALQLLDSAFSDKTLASEFAKMDTGITDLFAGLDQQEGG
jgi:hypothetical protein